MVRFYNFVFIINVKNMPFKKVNPILEEALVRLGLDTPTELQKRVFPKMKSGENLFIVGEKGAGKSLALVMGVIQKLKAKQQGDNPRALIFVKNKEEAVKLKEMFDLFKRETGLRVSMVYEERIINHQKDEIYLGADIVIGTAKRISKLYFLNGINLMELILIAVEDAEFLTGTGLHTDIDRITQSMSRCQRIVVAEKMTDKIDKLKGLFMELATVVS